MRFGVPQAGLVRSVPLLYDCAPNGLAIVIVLLDLSLNAFLRIRIAGLGHRTSTPGFATLNVPYPCRYGSRKF
jgi:hypothetical protein